MTTTKFKQKNTMCTAVTLIALALFMLAILPARAETPAASTKTATVDAQVVLNAYQGLVEDHLSGVLRSIRAVAMSSEATPISPPSGPTKWLFQGPPAASK